MCSFPVTFGGGMRITNGGFSEGSSGVKAPQLSQASYHFASNDFGSKRVGSSSERLTRPSRVHFEPRV